LRAAERKSAWDTFHVSAAGEAVRAVTGFASAVLGVAQHLSEPDDPLGD
jgi:hypothetical protein